MFQFEQLHSKWSSLSYDLGVVGDALEVVDYLSIPLQTSSFPTLARTEFSSMFPLLKHLERDLVHRIKRVERLLTHLLKKLDHSKFLLQQVLELNASSLEEFKECGVDLNVIERKQDTIDRQSNLLREINSILTNEP